MTNQALKEEDLKYIWHPCSQMKDYETLPLVPIKSGKGVYLTDYDGNEYIDAISSWWVNIFGHSNEYINSRVKEQLDTLEHVIFAGFTHEPAVRLSKRLINLTASNLQKIFFADNGSSAVEIALKMAFQYHKNDGKVKDIFFSLKNSYHGETLGALAIGDVELYKDIYKDIMLKTVQVASPSLVDEDEAIEDFKKKLKEHEGRVSAIIIEPLVQCAGYMQMYDKSYIKKLKAICEEEGIFLIADEIAVGFGRTGELFVCDEEIKPDFLCLSKGLTGGYLPLSVVLTTNEVYQKFYCDYSEGKAFLHSHSYTGNPLGCAAANATLDIFENENIIEKNRAKVKKLEELLEKFKSLLNVKEVRQRGLIGAVELKGYKPEERIALKVYDYALKNGVLLRPLGHVVYFMPPFVITDKELEKVVQVAYEAITTLP
ncbi:MAG TPA: adenosylmethionine--8-amino-7-oxononanoate transaminase [Campylobacterales bacterium]|nr:adenosylmethionine--8-amino-7-oxononanoate transaminase [Campylobacterales bacterium]